MIQKPSYEELQKQIEEIRHELLRGKQIKTHLEFSLSHLQTILDSTADGILVVDGEGTIVLFNKQFARMWGIPDSILDSKDDEKAISFVLDQLQSPQDFLSKVKELYAKPETESFDTLQFKDGRVFERYSRPHYLNGDIIGRVWSFHDVTEKKRAEKELRDSEERFRSLSENSIVGVNIIQEGVIKYANNKFAEIFGYSVEECLNNMNYQQLVHPEDLPIVQKKIRRRISGEVNSVHYTFRGIKKNKEIVHVEIFGSSIQVNGKAAVVGAILDITERRQMEQELRRLATIDSLTGISNRRHFLDSAQKEMKRLLRYNHPFSMIMMDIDHFKKINDTHGHSTGDQVLREFCELCLKEIRESDIMGRLGGEEFAIALVESDLAAAGIIAERIRKTVASRPVPFDDRKISFTVSLGITEMCADDNLDSILERADNALYSAKQNGRNQVCTCHCSQ